MINRSALALVLLSNVLLSCSTHQPVESTNEGRYDQAQDSGPDQDQSVDRLADAVPRWEPQTIAGNRSPYRVNGKEYTILTSQKGYAAEGVSSWYGQKFHGHKTANGEIYDMFAMSAAHKTLPIPSYVRVTNLANHKQVVVRVNDRGPFHGNRLIDLSYAAAKKLGFHHLGTTQVRIEAIAPIKESVNRLQPLTALAPERVHKAAKLPENTYLQVGAFSEKNKAITIRQQLLSVVKVPILVVPHQTRNLYRVRLGPISNHWQLANMRHLLAKHNFIQTQLVTES